MYGIDPRILIIAPNYRQAQIFLMNMGWKHRYFRVALGRKDLLGMRLENWEVWWLDCMWPCRTHEDVEFMEEMKRLAKQRGADLRRWWT